MRTMYSRRLVIVLAAACAIPTALAGDGEGTVRIVTPARLIAGATTRIVIELTAGPSGIPVGGGVCLGFHHAASWPGVQVVSPAKEGYIAFESASKGNFDVRWHGWAPAGTFAENRPSGASDGIHHQTAIAKVVKEPIAPGETVRITIGAGELRATVQTMSDPGHEFHISTDVDGDGVYAGVAEQPRMDILPAAPHHLVASVPAQVEAGTPFEIQIRAEDAFYNFVDTYEGTVEVRDELGNVLLPAVALSGAPARVTLQMDRPGPQRFRLSADGLSGRSNPCKAFGTLPALRLYWGDIHGHTSVSDGLGADAREFFAFGRDVAGLDVCALTDHGHFDWPANIAAVKEFHAPHQYVALLAQESGAGPDHMNFYFRGDDTPHIEGWPSRYDQLYDMLQAQYNGGERPEVITGPHHFTYDRGDDRYPFGIWDARSARFVEVYSSHGTSEYPGNPRPLPGAKDERKFMQAGLAKGLRFGVIGSSDNHDSKPGRTRWGHYPGGLVAFLAPELTREAIWDALWNYRVYATSFDRIYLEFTVEGEPVGSDLEHDGPCKIAYTVIGKDDTLSVHLIRNNEEIRVDRTDRGVVEVSLTDLPPEAENFYYLRVVQANGERAWSTPIWVRH